MKYPTREIVDDYLATVDTGLCTMQCGRARDDICVCRCGGEYHNLLREWWASPEYRATGDHWCATCQRAHPGTLAPGTYVLVCAPAA